VRSAETLVFAEGAVTEGGAGAAAGGLAFEVSSAEVLVLGRAYGDRYLSLHARPFGYYSGTVSGERGLFTGLTLKSSKAHLALGNDVHSRSRLGGAGSRPSGSQTFAELGLSAGDFTLTLAEKFTVGEEPPEDADAPAGLACGETGAGQRAALVALAPGRAGDGTVETRRLRSRLDLQYRASGRLRVRVRYESLSARESLGRAETRSASDLLRFDAAVDRLGPLSVDAGFQVFTVEDYAARLYQYEIGLPYYPSLVLLKADGSRWYGVVKLDLERLGSIAAKYGVTIYDDGEEDSGLLASYSARF